MEYDARKLAERIEILIKEKGRKIGEFEDSLGLSIGLIGRWKRLDKSSKGPSLSIILRIAKALDVSLDYLFAYDYIDDNENMLVSYVEKLLHSTEKGNIIWQKRNVFGNHFLERYGVGVFEFFVHEDEAYSNINLFEVMYNSNQTKMPEIFYERGFVDGCSAAILMPEYYVGRLCDGKELLILNVLIEGEGQLIEGYDVYLDLNYFCSGDDEEMERVVEPVYSVIKSQNRPLTFATQNLLGRIEECLGGTYITPRAKALIRHYINTSTEKKM